MTRGWCKSHTMASCAIETCFRSAISCKTSMTLLRVVYIHGWKLEGSAAAPFDVLLLPAVLSA